MKKFIRRIGKGIKRLGKKLTKFVGRIGKKISELPALGQLALAIAMPYAAGAIWKGISSLAGVAGAEFSWATLGTVGQTLATGSPNVLSKVLGRTMQAISWTAQAPGKAYNFITDMIGVGIDKLQNSDFIQGTKDWMQNTFGVQQLDTTNDVISAGKYIPFEDLTDAGMKILRDATPAQAQEISKRGLQGYVDEVLGLSPELVGDIFKPPTPVSPILTYEETIGILKKGELDEMLEDAGPYGYKKDSWGYKQATTPATGEDVSPEDIAIKEGLRQEVISQAASLAKDNEVAVGRQSLGTVVDLNLSDPSVFSDVFAGVDLTNFLNTTGRNGVQSHPWGEGVTTVSPFDQVWKDVMGQDIPRTRGGVTVMPPQFFSTQPERQ